MSYGFLCYSLMYLSLILSKYYRDLKLNFDLSFVAESDTSDGATGPRRKLCLVVSPMLEKKYGIKHNYMASFKFTVIIGTDLQQPVHHTRFTVITHSVTSRTHKVRSARVTDNAL